MKIYPTYTSDDWVKDTIIIDGIRQYYAGVLGCMHQLPLAYYSRELGNASRIKPYENTLHAHEAYMGKGYSPYRRVKSILYRWG